MKRTLVILATVLYFGLINGNAQLFPSVDKVASPEMSMIALQFAHDNDGKMENVINNNFTGWAPVVKGPDGNIVPFRNFDAGADMTNIYYAENLKAGEYTLIGFYHVYTDYGKLDEYKKEFGEKHMPIYEPYVDKKYHIKQVFELKEPIVLNLEPNKIMSFGSFAVKHKWVGGIAGTTDDRWKMDEQHTAITLEKPFDNYVLRYMKPWATPKWKKWNEKNSASPL